MKDEFQYTGNEFQREPFQIRIRYLDLTQTADSGQCFRWRKINSGEYEIPAFHRKLRVRQQGEQFTFYCSEQEFREVWWDYLDLSGDYEGYLRSVDEEDDFLKAAASYGSGIRILKQDPWETAVSFLISQCNNIPRIKGCIEKLCRYFGDGGYDFPTPERLAGLDEEELSLFRKNCSLGYRDRYILDLARKVAEGSFDLEECGKLPYEECIRQLRTLQGVGQKVADCIALFGFHKTDAFPIDVHMKQILYDHYYSEELAHLPRTRQLKTMEERYFSRYSGYRGIVQQWMFAYTLSQR
ncbi:MAG: DNA glycosylase [Lachnospiraceae bacterium]|nr:DNA glycosylase [Lachnospiraceae bacterium]